MVVARVAHVTWEQTGALPDDRPRRRRLRPHGALTTLQARAQTSGARLRTSDPAVYATCLISRSALSRPTRAHQPMLDGSVSVVLAGVSPAEW